MEALAKPPRLHESNDCAPDIPGPAVAHCGAWHPLTALPWWCPVCGDCVGLSREETLP